MTGDARGAVDAKTGAPSRHPLNDLLLEDLRHFGESLWRNDEIGEKRFNFFLTLVTAVIAGLVSLLNGNGDLTDIVPLQELGGPNGPKALIAAVGLWMLFGFGLLTYVRLVLRNRNTAEYHRTLRYIRKRMISLYPDSPLDEYVVPQTPASGRFAKALKGGLTGITGIMTGGLLFLAVVLSTGSVWLAGALGPAAAVALWAVAVLERGRDRAEQYFRAGAGAVILDQNGNVLVLKRRDTDDKFWQLPQGGLKVGEEPEPAVFREICEETGINKSDLELLGEVSELLAYELPGPDRSLKTGRGQVHHWFVFRFCGTDIQLPSCGEFQSKQWIPLDQLASNAVGFRKSVYGRLPDLVRQVDRRA